MLGGGEIPLFVYANSNLEAVIASSAATGVSTPSPGFSLTNPTVTAHLLQQNSPATSFSYRANHGRISITSTTDVTATRNTATTDAHTLAYCLLVWNPALIKSLKRYSVTVGAGSASANATLNPNVTVANSIILPCGFTSTNNTDGETSCANHLTFASSSAVTVTRIGTTGSITAAFYVVEFNSGVLLSNQAISISIGSGVGSNTQTVTAVSNADKCLCILQGWSGSSGFDKRSFPRLSYPDAGGTTVTASKGTSAPTDTVVVKGQLIEFHPAIVFQRQKGSMTGSTTSINSTLASNSRMDKTAVFPGGNTVNLDFSNANSVLGTIKQTSETNVRFSHASTTTTTNAVEYETIQSN